MAADTKPRKTIKLLQIADGHLDFKYVVGSIADCGESYCCRNETYKGQGTILAGMFGTL
jgi:hypothetical protein